MMIHEITPLAGRHRRRKRVGRGHGSGKGKTAGRGHNGQRSRSGYSRQYGREGGQMPWFMRFPKRGFSNARFEKRYTEVNLGTLEARFDSGETVDAASLSRKGLVRNPDAAIKVLAGGSLSKALHVHAASFSRRAEEALAATGGSATRTE